MAPTHRPHTIDLDSTDGADIGLRIYLSGVVSGVATAMTNLGAPEPLPSTMGQYIGGAIYADPATRQEVVLRMLAIADAYPAEVTDMDTDIVITIPGE